MLDCHPEVFRRIPRRSAEGRDLRVQYFLTYCVIGSVLPFVSVYFRHSGLSNAQVAYAWTLWSAAVVLSPVVVTLAADAHADPRRLLVLGSALGGVSLLSLGLVHGVGPVMGVWTVYCLTSQPLLPLQDGVHFSTQRRRRERGQPEEPYHLVRVWGTIGYIVPSVLLFVLLQLGMSLLAALWTGAACAALAAAQATLLADPRPKNLAQADSPPSAPQKRCCAPTCSSSPPPSCSCRWPARSIRHSTRST